MKTSERVLFSRRGAATKTTTKTHLRSHGDTAGWAEDLNRRSTDKETAVASLTAGEDQEEESFGGPGAFDHAKACSYWSDSLAC